MLQYRYGCQHGSMARSAHSCSSAMEFIWLTKAHTMVGTICRSTSRQKLDLNAFTLSLLGRVRSFVCKTIPIKNGGFMDRCAILREEETVCFRRLRLTRCLECFYQDYNMLHLAGCICSLASLDVTGDTLNRVRGCGQPARGVGSSFMKMTSAGHHSDQS